MKWYLDFGHGGKDPGAIGPTNLKESDVALKIGMIIKENLENVLEKVITTRDNDKYYSLDYRTKKANNENSDYFISIHLNSATNTSAKGCEVWIYNENSKLQTLANNLCNNLATKMNTPGMELFLRGLLCNVLVCLATWMCYKLKEETSKLIMIWWCLFTFITAGFEHSVANMSFLTMGLLLPHGADVSIMGMAHNLLWVSLGNFVGGVLFVGLPYYFITKEK